jgi:hypothetical protein
MSTALTAAHRIATHLEVLRRRRRDLRTLRRELHSYTGRPEVEDLLVALDRHDGPDVARMRSILSAQALRRERSSWSLPIAS